MDQQQVKQIAQRFISELHHVEDGEGNDVAGIVDLFADDAELTNSLIERDGVRPRRTGRDEIRKFWQAYRHTFRDIHSEFTDVTVSDHSAGLFWCTKCADTAGRPLAYEGVSLLTVDDAGKIKHFKGYFDVAQLHC